RYFPVPVDWRRGQKTSYLSGRRNLGGIKWQTLRPDRNNNWITAELADDFSKYTSIGSKTAKRRTGNAALFRTYSRGVCSNSDAYVYSFDRGQLIARAEAMVDAYNAELARWRKA